jgi:hypothetical protein
VDGQPVEPDAPAEVGEVPVDPRIAQQQRMQLEYYRRMLAQQQQQQRAAQEEAFEASLQGLTEDEAEWARMERENQEMREQQQKMQQYVLMQKYAQYYQQFAPNDVWGNGRTIQEMGHLALVHLHQQNSQLRQELEALKKASVAPPAAPNVSQTPAAQPGKKSVWDMSWKEIEQRRKAAEQGLPIDPVSL